MSTSSPASASLVIPNSLHDRLSLPLVFRLPLSTTVGAFSGFLLGLAKGSQDSGLRFQAENAHRLPSTQTGWFLYHKSKNYNMMLGGILEGMKQGFRYSLWVGLYFVLEEGVDRGRVAGARMFKGSRDEWTGIDRQNEAVIGSRDCMSSMLAGLGAAGFFSAWHQFPVPTAARTAKMGAKAGFVFGLLQDGLSLLKGRPVGYVEFAKKHLFGRNEELSHEFAT